MSFQTILLWVLFAIASVILLAAARKNASQDDVHTSIRKIAIDATFIAIIALMTFIPQVGYITVIPGVSFTLIHIPVLVGAYLMGWKRGAIYGLAFGVFAWIASLMSGTGFNALFILPWVSIPPRLLFGLAAGLFFQLIRKVPKIYARGIIMGLGAFLLSCLHTVLVFGDLYLCYPSVIGGYFASSVPMVAGLGWTFLILIAVGMIGEAILAAIIVPALGAALRRALPGYWEGDRKKNA